MRWCADCSRRHVIRSRHPANARSKIASTRRSPEGWVARWYDGIAQREHDETKALALELAERLPARASVLEVAPGYSHLHIKYVAA